MIELCYQNNNVFVYNIEDWEKLRKEYRVIGELFGNTQFVPTLPLKLPPEVTLLLINKEIANLVQYNYKEPNEENKNKYVELSKTLLEEEKKVYKSLRKQQLETMLKQVVDGKRKKGDTRTNEEILEEELNKSSDINDKDMLWPIFIQDSDLCEKINIEIPPKYIEQTTKLKIAVYKDLWEKGYYITSSCKFGGDFLIYAGDPIAYHAIYIIRCIENYQKGMHTSEIVAFGRLGTTVKKKAVLAFFDGTGNVCYVTLNWIDA